MVGPGGCAGDTPADRRCRIVSIAPTRRRAISAWLGRGATAWQRALDPLTPDQRRVVVDTLRAYESGMGEGS